VPKRMKQPIYVYYQLENFYQNHRRYCWTATLISQSGWVQGKKCSHLKLDVT